MSADVLDAAELLDELALEPDELCLAKAEVTEKPEDDNVPENEIDMAGSGRDWLDPAKAMPAAQSQKHAVLQRHARGKRGRTCPIR